MNAALSRSVIRWWIHLPSSVERHLSHDEPPHQLPLKIGIVGGLERQQVHYWEAAV